MQLGVAGGFGLDLRSLYAQLVHAEHIVGRVEHGEQLPFAHAVTFLHIYAFEFSGGFERGRNGAGLLDPSGELAECRAVGAPRLG